MTSPKAKISLGQHFITDPSIGHKVARLMVNEGQTYHAMLEVGPGKGILTRALADETATNTWLKAIELDTHWHQWLRQKLANTKVELLKGSVLELDFEKLFDGDPWGLIGNFPYNVASQIILKAAAANSCIPELAGMFQLEVAQRLTASPGSKQYGLLSVLFQAFYTSFLAFKLRPGAFYPPPKVHSAVVYGHRRPQKERIVPFEWLKPVVKQAFAHRRKKLSNTLKTWQKLVAEEDPALLDKRTEDVGVDSYQRLAFRIGTAGAVN